MMEKIGQSIWPFLLGTLAGMIGLSFGMGFMGPASATKLADQARVDGVLSISTPLCVSAAQAAPTALTELLALPANKQRDALNATGWATYPAEASSSLTRAIDDGCLKALKA